MSGTLLGEVVVSKVLGVLKEIAEAKGNKKIEVLKKFYDENTHVDVAILKDVVHYTLNPQMSYYTTKINEKVMGTLFDLAYGPGNKEITDFFKVLDELNDKGSCTHADQIHLDSVYDSLTNCGQDIARRIIARDLGIGAGLSTFRKVFGKNFIPDYPFQKASSFDMKKIEKNIIFPAKSELKSDGAAVIVHFDEDGDCTEIRSGNGRVINSSYLKETLKSICSETGCRVRGELVVLDENGKILPRAKGNGIINKAIKGTISPLEDAQLCVVAWEWYTEEDVERNSSEMTYSLSNKMVETCIELTDNDSFRMIEGKIVNSLQEAKAHYLEMISRGEEGIILKDLGSTWAKGRNKLQFKYKVEETTELIVVDTTPHSKKEGQIGALVCESSDGLIKARLGSGLKAKDNVQKPEHFIGKIVEAKFNNITDVRKDGTRSLFLPRYVDIRPDKNEAHDSAHIIKSFNDSIGLELIK